MYTRPVARNIVVALTATVALALTGCSASAQGAGAPSDTFSAEDIESALQEESTLTVWSFSPNVVEIAEAFEKEYPKVTVEVENVGTGGAYYTKLQNAIEAGKGGPDIATIEYNMLPQFVLTEDLVDLRQFGFEDKEDLYDPSVWQTVTVNGGLYELPRGFGPMGLFYNATVFDKYGVEVPTTWDEYLDAARTIHAADPNAYIAADTGDANVTNSLMWAFGGTPYGVDGETVSVDFSDAGTTAYSEFYGKLIDEGLLAPIATWSTEWYSGLADGTIASAASGAWFAATLQSGVPAGDGHWRVAPLPSVDEASPTSGLQGGGGDAILEQSDNKLVAAAFLEFMSAGPGVQISVDMDFYPSTLAELNAPEFLDDEKEYFGGQAINQVFLESAERVNPEWQFLPYNAYAQVVFPDTVGPAYLGEASLEEGLTAWQDKLRSYGEKQGFTVAE